MIKQLPVFFAVLLWLLSSVFAVAQCCGAGSPVSGDAEQRTIAQHALKTFVIHKYSYSDTYYDGSTKLDIVKPIGMLKTSEFNYSELNLIYGLTSKMSVQTALGYFWNKTMDYQNATLGRLSGSGLADLTLSAKYTAYKSFFRQIEITPGLGVKIPIGVFDQYQNGALLPITIQPSSGSYKYQASLTMYKGFRSSNFSLLSYNAIELSSVINSPSFANFRAGNLYVNSIFFVYAFKKLSAVVQVRNEYRDMEIRNANLKTDTGGEIVYIAPSVGFHVFEKLGLSIGLDYPIYRHYNAVQLGNNFSLNIRLSRDFNFQTL